MNKGRKPDGRKRLGAWGESVAAHHLEAKGYEIVIRNWRCRQGEVDLIARAGTVWVFVEVKTRRGRSMGTPEEALTPYKSKKLLQIAQIYLAEHDLDVDWRIDLVAVELDKAGKLLRCEQVENAVLGW
ncbi:MAG: YraN family protein [Anaerolineales bacterium]|nr:YraN family protein [Anaerolineales bacterium]MCA9932135.1 YraN family protein [Anaerolineales bacterium]